MNPFYTHQEFLIEILSSFNYDNEINCLEFGCGDGSSIIFYEFANKHKNLKIQCFEHDESWLNKMKLKYELPNYEFNLVNWETMDFSSLKNKTYDFVFVDQGNWDSRIKTIDELSSNTNCFILHDYCFYNGFRGNSEPSNLNFYNVDENSFFSKYHKNFKLIPQTNSFPPTLILHKKNEKNN
jgi:hypothetical protein